MKKSRLALAQNTLSHKKLIRTTLLLPAIILTIFTTSSQATYQYTYYRQYFYHIDFQPKRDG